MILELAIIGPVACHFPFNLAIFAPNSQLFSLRHCEIIVRMELVAFTETFRILHQQLVILSYT